MHTGSWLYKLFSRILRKRRLGNEEILRAPTGVRQIYKKPNRVVYRVFIHCSASDHPDHDDISVIRKWHLDRGFADVGYHYFIQRNGNTQEGRSLELIPAAQYGFNTGSIAICLHGSRKELFSKEQKDALYNLCRQIHLAHNGAIIFKGHCEVNKNKDCPVIEYKQILMLDNSGKMC